MATKSAIKKVYDAFIEDPEGCERSYLHNHYRRGREGVMRPSVGQDLALAAWRAGRDAVAAEEAAK